ncbi:KTSC domain-containing protein [Salinivibrio proteolyticus]|uniref:KTSC domain-containing protein n=1 Tax=Salinivibrio proteolyticus TaxID=334715 RepID=A0ABY7LEJ5_9GAMM|nr:KTSC domain-containing protein [Salinivibrio proteolyticus]WBA15523.1 KTSC domain-containing protein [Salinivibrio proteolyticus]
MIISFHSHAGSWCEKNIDKLQLFYVNGMYTTPSAFISNIKDIDDFQDGYLTKFSKNGPVEGAYNDYEGHLGQIYEVARQKYQDLDTDTQEYRLLTAILGGYILELSSEDFNIITPFIIEVMSYLPDHDIRNEVEYKNAKMKLGTLLNDCARTIVIGHSQGNFYSNALVSDIGSSFVYPNGYAMSEYPMIGMMGIASPASSVGGEFGSINPNMVDVLTNNNDLIMELVRDWIGSVPSNYDAVENLLDSTGHGLAASYLHSHGQASTIASKIDSITSNLVPFPLFEQHPSSSSAISHIGYSEVSELLDVRFNYGGGYRYTGVSNTIWEQFYYSTSHGKFFNEKIKDHYLYRKIEQ